MGLFKKILGSFGEKTAAKMLTDKGYKILMKNYKAVGCEIDLIARKDGTLVFIEVKTRSSDNYGTPEEAINHSKAQNITKAALAYMHENKISDVPVRCDVVSIIIDNRDKSEKLDIIENAIDMEGVIRQKRWVN